MASGRSYIPVDRVIERVYSDWGLPRVQRHEAIEWIVDALFDISPTDLLMNSHSEVRIENGRGALPKGFESMNPGGVRIKGGEHLVEQTGAFSTASEIPAGLSIYVVEGQSIIYDQEGTLVDPAALPTSVISAIHSANTVETSEYSLKDGWIFCGIRDTILELSYKSLIVDPVKGEPLVPDNTKIIRALVSSVAHKIARRYFIKGELQQAVYREINTEYLFDVGSARSDSKMLSPDQMESLKRRYLSLIPRVNEHSDGFSSSNNTKHLAF